MNDEPYFLLYLLSSVVLLFFLKSFITPSNSLC